jgi:hypothetical protein
MVKGKVRTMNIEWSTYYTFTTNKRLVKTKCPGINGQAYLAEHESTRENVL